MKGKPLASIIIPNYNHSMYLDQSLQSALNQTYGNVEIVLLDNQSEDRSVEIASKYMKQGVRVCRNPYNYANASYRILSEILVDKDCKYLMMLPADDYIQPTFVEKSVKLMEENANVGYVHVERDFLTNQGELLEQDPFYTCSFIVAGEKTMPIYMMSTVAQAAQGIYRMETFRRVGGYDLVVDHMNVDRTLWFYLSAISDYAYIREKLACIRVGASTETFLTQTNFQHPILTFMTILEFADFAERNGMTAVVERKQAALDKYAVEYLNHCVGAIATENFVLAKKYLVFCKVVSRAIVNHPVYLRLSDLVEKKEVDMEYLRAVGIREYQRKRSYEPPEGYRQIAVG